jgi:hypothetical protein
MRKYKVLLPLLVHTEDSSYGQGEVFEKEFESPEDEAANLDSGLLELQPLKYRNVGGSTVHGVEPGEEFELPLRMGEEKALLEGGHIELVEEPKPKAKAKKKEVKK